MHYHKSWEKFVNSSKFLTAMQEFVENTPNLCPDKTNVFRFFNNDFDNAKCVILGMDPYKSTYINNNEIIPVATGRSFEVANVNLFTDKYKQKSLSMIFKALCYYKFDTIYSINDLRKEEFKDKIKYINIHDWFDAMEINGVIFLNSTLTTVIGKTGEHIRVWIKFMNELFNFININSNCKWLVWGNLALERVKEHIDNDKIIYSCHPASRMNNNFVEDCCFKKINSIKWF